MQNRSAVICCSSLAGCIGKAKKAFLRIRLFFCLLNNLQYSDSCAACAEYMLVINANSEYITESLAFINMLADPDVYMQFMCGPEGELWYVENGVTYLADGVAEKQVNGETLYLSTGEEVGYSTFPLDWVIDDTSFPTSYVDADGDARTVKFLRWSEVLDLMPSYLHLLAGYFYCDFKGFGVYCL